MNNCFSSSSINAKKKIGERGVPHLLRMCVIFSFSGLPFVWLYCIYSLVVLIGCTHNTADILKQVEGRLEFKVFQTNKKIEHSLGNLTLRNL